MRLPGHVLPELPVASCCWCSEPGMWQSWEKQPSAWLEALHRCCEPPVHPAEWPASSSKWVMFLVEATCAGSTCSDNSEVLAATDHFQQKALTSFIVKIASAIFAFYSECIY